MIVDAKRRASLDYRAAGVDIDRAAAAVSRIAERARLTFGDHADLGIGHFGGLYRLPGSDRCLVASADGVGTKLKLAFVLGGEAHASVGRDLVNHCVNDVLALGARPLFFLDYVGMGKLESDVLERVVGGMIDSCQENDLVLLGGETAEMPGMYADGEYDVAGFIVGEVGAGAIIDGSQIAAGDVLIGLPSDGLHTNGYSLARRIVGLTGEPNEDRAILGAMLPGGGNETLGQALMRPHRSYWRAVGPMLEAGQIRGMAHITGGGLVDNIPRMLPDHVRAVINPSVWPQPPLFQWLVKRGGIAMDEAFRVFNMGIGFVLAVRRDACDDIFRDLEGAVQIGYIAPADASDRCVEWDPA
ncbi:MAG TPA: phosphoribosylformylglycinamidine cyclo-ligase [Thermomicrobiales bacterium]|nr:phosphoribosylformylglycinamidine cyclo-ligase [Thermomicrobiales bacterium]